MGCRVVNSYRLEQFSLVLMSRIAVRKGMHDLWLLPVSVLLNGP